MSANKNFQWTPYSFLILAKRFLRVYQITNIKKQFLRAIHQLNKYTPICGLAIILTTMFLEAMAPGARLSWPPTLIHQSCSTPKSVPSITKHFFFSPRITLKLIISQRCSHSLEFSYKYQNNKNLLL